MLRSLRRSRLWRPSLGCRDASRLAAQLLPLQNGCPRGRSRSASLADERLGKLMVVTGASELFLRTHEAPMAPQPSIAPSWVGKGKPQFRIQ